MAQEKRKSGPPQGVGQWKNLETAGDVKRFLAWTIHSLRRDTLDVRTAATLGQLGCYLLRAIEGNDLEQRIVGVERALQERSDHHESHQTH